MQCFPEKCSDGGWRYCRNAGGPASGLKSASFIWWWCADLGGGGETVLVINLFKCSLLLFFNYFFWWLWTSTVKIETNKQQNATHDYFSKKSQQSRWTTQYNTNIYTCMLLNKYYIWQTLFPFSTWVSWPFRRDCRTVVEKTVAHPALWYLSLQTD